MSAKLTAGELLPDGPLRQLGARVVLLDEIDSTNAWLLRAAEDMEDGTLVLAEHQLAGRGRLGRRWMAAPGTSLLLSVLLLDDADGDAKSPAAGGAVSLAPHATILAAVAVCEAVEATTACTPRLRWPNDVVVDGRKLSGVLAETRTLESRRRAIALGIGLNCDQDAARFEPELIGKATSLAMLAPAVRRGQVGAALLGRLDAWVLALRRSAAGVAELQRAWRQRCADIGARVTLWHDAREFRGTVLDITDCGDLEVQLDSGGRRRFGATTTTRNR